MNLKVEVNLKRHGEFPMLRFLRLCLLLAAIWLPLAVFGSAHAGENTSYPITIKHALGTTVIENKPERVATVAWANHGVPPALGTMPEGLAASTCGND